MSTKLLFKIFSGELMLCINVFLFMVYAVCIGRRGLTVSRQCQYCGFICTRGGDSSVNYSMITHRNTMQTDKYGRSFKWGKALSDEFKDLILDELKKNVTAVVRIRCLLNTMHTVKLLKSLMLV